MRTATRIQQTLAVLSVGTFATACATDEQDVPQATPTSSDTGDLLAGSETWYSETRQRLLSQLDQKNMRIRLGPDMSRLTPAATALPFDAARFVTAIEKVSGVPVGPTISDELATQVAGTGMLLVAESTRHRIRVGTDSKVLVRGPHDFIPGPSGQIPDADFVEVAENLMRGLGATKDEWGEPYLFRMGQGTRSEEEGPQPVQDAALVQLVRYDRTVGGIPVRGNRMTFGFHLDGSFEDMRGRWQPINFSKSDLATTLSEDDVKRQGIEALLNEGLLRKPGLDPPEDPPIAIETFYVTSFDAASGQYVLDLRAEAAAYLGEGEGAATLDLMYDI